MKRPVYCVRDKMVGFMQPILDTNDDSAIRNFKYGVTRNDAMAFSSDDYELYFIGEFDTADALFDRVVPKLLIRGSDVV